MAEEKRVTADGKVIAQSLPITGFRKTIVRHMATSLTTTSQVTGSAEVDVTKLVALRKRLKEEGISYTYTEFFAKLMIEAVKKYPIVNSSVSEDGKRIEIYSNINLGVAVANDKEFAMVPVIRDSQDLTLPQLSAEIKKCVAAVREGTISPEMLQGGTITISSMGMYAVDVITPVLNMPQNTIIALGRIRKQLVMEPDGTISAHDIMNVNVTCHHGIIDGVPHSKFMTEYATMLSDPEPYLGILR